MLYEVFYLCQGCRKLIGTCNNFLSLLNLDSHYCKMIVFSRKKFQKLMLPMSCFATCSLHFMFNGRYLICLIVSEMELLNLESLIDHWVCSILMLPYKIKLHVEITSFSLCIATLYLFVGFCLVASNLSICRAQTLMSVNGSYWLTNLPTKIYLISMLFPNLRITFFQSYKC